MQDFDPANFVILVVDDDVAVRALIAKVLWKEGYQVRKKQRVLTATG